MTADKSFEQNLKSLEKIVEKLESGSTTLDEALDLFQKGKVLSRVCEARLREAEIKIHQLVETAEGEPGLAPLDAPPSENT